ncbi:hypothetical protein HELRODRAFT_139196, partial [Helobdella robusta]|uniref:3',5'-cyclic-AMP phosphodiesterase n=1 Tax=Helobdella robusta TaxID=6412 RepID=T1EIY3_HELRO
EEFSLEILDDLDWCLDQLEAIQTHRSVGDLATSKFKRMLTKELSHLAESSKSGSQISEYISNTFLVVRRDVFCRKNFDKSNKLKRIWREKIVVIMFKNITCNRSAVETMIVISIHVRRLDKMMNGSLTDWNLSVFTLDKMTNGRSLTVMAYTIFKQRDLTKKFNIPHATLLSYLALVEGHYNPMASYHNHIHATDVTHAVHVILKKAPLLDVFTDLEILSVIFSSIIHDVDHPGLTNNHLINTNSELALMYNDESVLENHHLAVAFKLMQRNQCDIFCNVPPKIRQRIRKMTIDMVLATDMSKHMSLLADMKTMVETKKVSGTGLQLSENYNERIQVLKCLLHCADLCNPAKHLPIYSQWIERVMQEFFNQGDIERDLGLDISPMCDRHTASVEKSQVGFIDFIVQPLWETWAELVDPYCNDILDEIETNRNYFQLLSDNNETSP